MIDAHSVLPFEWVSKVLRGKGIGHTLGFATANLSLPDAEGVLRGVYAAQVAVEGAWLPAVVNIGSHPTLPEGPPTAEVHAIGFAGDLYDMRLRVRLLSFLREERRFDSIEDLRRQIEEDVKKTLALQRIK